jgi:hypothetical protein
MHVGTSQIKSFLNWGPLIPLGRFPAWRRGCSRLMSLKRRPELSFHANNIENAGSRFAKTTSTFFDPRLIDECAQDLFKDGISPRLRLPDEAVDALTAFAQAATFRPTDDSAPIKDVNADDATAASSISGLRSICSDITASPQIMQILADHVLCQIATRYLGYQPSVVEAYLERLSSPQRVKTEGIYPPFGYHYDVPGFNFLGFFFYLTDVNDATGGAHVMIRKSCRDKPLRFMLQSARSAGYQVDTYYPLEDTLVIHGTKGSGFAEDLYSFHKVLPPKGEDRLTLQIRYY